MMFTYNLRASLNYQLTSKISVGPYVGYGITDVSGSGGGVENTKTESTTARVSLALMKHRVKQHSQVV